jgi:phenylpropionate dioxygenase-like ring-hydroxylating dioxygenase large terminal subunit
MTYDTRQPGPFGGPVQPNYPRNTWWVAARSSEVTQQPYACQMLDAPVVLFRDPQGRVAALHDRCPHRWAPLSTGWVEGDRLVCGYHGMAFDAKGHCVNVPTQSQIPSKAVVKSYPTRERYGLVWVWMGDAAAAEGTELPNEVDFLEGPDWTVVTGHMLLASNYMMLKENVLDLTHFGYVHRNSLQITDWTHPPEVVVGDTTVTYSQPHPLAPLAPPYGVPTGIGMERPVHRRTWGQYVTPALNFGAVDIRDPAPPAGRRSTFQLRIVHLTTPVSPVQTRYWWFMAWDITGMSPEYVEAWRLGVPKAFGEDDAMLAAVTRTVLADHHGCDYPEVLLQADQAAVQARRKVQQLIDRERGA